MRDELHGEDIVLLSERQAEALRRLADRRPDAEVDWPRVIGTVEGAGRGLLHEVEAETVRALYWHLMLAPPTRGPRTGGSGLKRPNGAGSRPGFSLASQLRVKLGTMRPPISITSRIVAAMPSRIPYSAAP